MNPYDSKATATAASPRRFRGRRTTLAVCAFALLSGAAMAQTPSAAAPDPAAPHLIYLPSNTTNVDHVAIVQAFVDQGFNVSTYAYAGENRLDYARRIAGEIRSLIRQGVDPADINVVGAGGGSPVALLTSAVTGNRHVNYVVLGQCDEMLKQQYRFRLAGNVLGIRDADDGSSHSCRPLWTGSPKLQHRQDLVLDTGHGAALFDAPRAEWLQPMMQWTTGGKVDIGELKIGRVEGRPAQGKRVAGVN